MSVKRRLLWLAIALLGIGTLTGVGFGLGALQAHQKTQLRQRYSTRAQVFAAFIQALLASSSSTASQAENTRRYGGRIDARTFARQTRSEHEIWAEVVGFDDGTVASYGPVPPALEGLVVAAARGTGVISGVAVGNVVEGSVPVALAFPTHNGLRVLLEGSQPGGVADLLSSLIDRVPGSVAAAKAAVIDGNDVVLGASPKIPVGIRYPNARLLAALGHSRSGALGSSLYYSAPVIGTWRVIVIAPASGVYATVSGVALPWIVLGVAAAMFLIVLGFSYHQIQLVASRERTNEELRLARAEQERLNADLARSNADLDLFASTASHDMRSPLRRIAGFAELVQSRLADLALGDENVEDYLDRIVKQSKTLDGLTTKLIEFARIGGAETERINLTKVALEACHLHQDAIDQLKAQVDVADLGYALGNVAALQEALSNVISNSLKYFTPGEVPRIEIHAERADGWVFIRVRDHGVGIALEDRKRAFAPSQRLNIEHEGYGMGLAMVERLVDRMGGAVSADSPLEGPGIVIVIALPEGATS